MIAMDNMEFRSELARLRAQPVHTPLPETEDVPFGFLKHLGLERERFDRDVEAIPERELTPAPAQRERFHAYRQAMQAYWAGVQALGREEMERRKGENGPQAEEGE